MDGLADWFDPHSAGGILTVVFGFVVVIQILGFFTTLATTAPIVAGIAVVAIALLGVFVWTVARNEASETSRDDSDQERRESDPLVVLKRRYARGELSEAEFEHRVAMLLDVDELAGRKQEAEFERA